MEDVLASIRRILDEGKGDLPEPRAESPPAAAIEPDPPPAPVPAPPEPAPADVFLLEPAMLIEEPAPMPQASTEEPAMAAYPLLSAEAQTATSGALGELMRTLTERQTQIYRSGPTLEDIVRDEMRPIIKTWLDTNLPPMVERLVRDEIERVVNRVVGL
jgi:cell pole-organizing protein PopZ